MKRALGLLVPVALFVAVGCGGESSLDSIVEGERRPSADEPTGTPPDAGERGEVETAPVDEEEQAATTTVPLPVDDGDVEIFCRLFEEFDETNDALDDAFDDFAFDGDLLGEAFAEARRALGDLARVAPDEIRRDMALLEEGLGLLLDELEAVDFNFFALDLEALDDVLAEFEDAGDRVDEYIERVCGIPSVDVDDFGDLDDFDLGELEDALDEFGDLFGDLEDFDMGEFDSFFTDLLVQEFLGEGYTQAEAECLAEAALDFESFFDALDGGFEALEDFQDPFERCGVTER